MAKKSMLMVIAEWLVIIGAINWLLTVFNFNLVTWIAKLVPVIPFLENLVYVLVGVSGIAKVVEMFK